jgi:hypothetical protein
VRGVTGFATEPAGPAVLAAEPAPSAPS